MNGCEKLRKSPQECETIARKIIENTTSEATDAESTTEFSEAVSALLETTDENTKWIIAKTREDYYPRESETMPGDDNDKLLTEKQAIAILNARIAPDNDKMIREIDHKVVIMVSRISWLMHIQSEEILRLVYRRP